MTHIQIMSSIRATPVKVSPVIKAARYSFLLFGMIYGINKKAFYEICERKEKSRRELMIKEYIRRKSEKSQKDFRDFIAVFANIFGVVLPPDWKPS